MAFWRDGVFGVDVPVRFTHDAVLLHGGARHPAPLPWLLLVMNVIVAPHPTELLFVKGQLPTPMGNSHVGGGVCGGLAIAMEYPAAFRPANPSSRRNVIGTVVW